MKSAPFAYVRPGTVDEACAELAADEDSKVLSGGQSLVPVLAMRLARPSTLVDINAVAGLDELRLDGAWLSVGATVRQRTLERAAETRRVPLLHKALPWVGHRELRSRGTVCGSLAHADPAAELPAVACCLDAQVEIAGSAGRRTVAARDFFVGAMTTALQRDEVLVGVRFPVAAAGEGFAFGEIARRHGDFALAGLATKVHVADGKVTAIVAGFGVADRPVVRSVDDELVELLHSASRAELTNLLTERAAPLADEMVTTAGDAHAGADYRKRLVRTLVARGLVAAYHDAVEGAR
ncbi:MAG: molybdopterin dehydrogenase [Streptosporangiales bacterium]|nr:molybdopterin dehydrogenase [Streptosporangiales bacterium]